MYNEFEKKLIEDLITKQYKTFADIIFDKYKFKEVKNTFCNYSGGMVGSVSVGDTVFLLKENEERSLLEYIAQTNSCIEKLVKKGYMSKEDIPASKRCNHFLVDKGQQFPNHAIALMQKIEALERIAFFYGQELKVLYNNDFKTPEEIAEERNALLAKRSLTVSIVAIIAPIVMTIITTIFSYCTYSKDRYVKIEDPITIQIKQEENLPIEVLNAIELKEIDSGEIPIIIKVIHEYPEAEEKTEINKE